MLEGDKNSAAGTNDASRGESVSNPSRLDKGESKLVAVNDNPPNSQVATVEQGGVGQANILGGSERNIEVELGESARPEPKIPRDSDGSSYEKEHQNSQAAKLHFEDYAKVESPGFQSKASLHAKIELVRYDFTVDLDDRYVAPNRELATVLEGLNGGEAPTDRIFLIYGPPNSGRWFSALKLGKAICDVQGRSVDQHCYWFELESPSLRELIQEIQTSGRDWEGSVLICSGKSKSGRYLAGVSESELAEFQAFLRAKDMTWVLIGENAVNGIGPEWMRQIPSALVDPERWFSRAIDAYSISARRNGRLSEMVCDRLPSILKSRVKHLHFPVQLGLLYRQLYESVGREESQELEQTVEAIVSQIGQQPPSYFVKWFEKLRPHQKLLALLIELLGDLPREIVQQVYWQTTARLRANDPRQFSNPLAESFSRTLEVVQASEDLARDRYCFSSESYRRFVARELPSYQSLLWETVPALEKLVQHASGDTTGSRYARLGKTIARICEQNWLQFSQLVVASILKNIKKPDSSELEIVCEAMKEAVAGPLGDDVMKLFLSHCYFVKSEPEAAILTQLSIAARIAPYLYFGLTNSAGQRQGDPEITRRLAIMESRILELLHACYLDRNRNKFWNGLVGVFVHLLVELFQINADRISKLLLDWSPEDAGQADPPNHPGNSSSVGEAKPVATPTASAESSPQRADESAKTKLEKRLMTHMVASLIWQRIGQAEIALVHLPAALRLLQRIIEIEFELFELIDGEMSEEQTEQFVSGVDAALPALAEPLRNDQFTSKVRASLCELVNDLTVPQRETLCQKIRENWCRPNMDSKVAGTGRFIIGYARLLNGEPFEPAENMCGVLMVEIPAYRRQEARELVREITSALSIRSRIAIIPLGRTRILYESMDSPLPAGEFDRLESRCWLVSPGLEAVGPANVSFLAACFWSSVIVDGQFTAGARSDLTDWLSSDSAVDGWCSRILVVRLKDNAYENDNSPTSRLKDDLLTTVSDTQPQYLQLSIRSRLSLIRRIERQVGMVLVRGLATRSVEDWQRLLAVRHGDVDLGSPAAIGGAIDNFVARLERKTGDTDDLHGLESISALFQLLLALDAKSALTLTGGWNRNGVGTSAMLGKSLFLLAVRFLYARNTCRPELVSALLDAATPLAKASDRHDLEIDLLFQLFYAWSSDPKFLAEMERLAVSWQTILETPSNSFRKKYANRIAAWRNKHVSNSNHLSTVQSSQVTNGFWDNAGIQSTNDEQNRLPSLNVAGEEFLDDWLYRLTIRRAEQLPDDGSKIFAIVLQGSGNGGKKVLAQIGGTFFKRLRHVLKESQITPAYYRIGLDKPVCVRRPYFDTSVLTHHSLEYPNLLYPVLEPIAERLAGVFLLADTPPLDWAECIEHFDGNAEFLTTSDQLKEDGHWFQIHDKDLGLGTADSKAEKLLEKFSFSLLKRR